MTARPFTFGEDLAGPALERRAQSERQLAAERAAVALAEREGFARGEAAGRAEAEAETARRLAEVGERLASGFAQALVDVDRRAGAIEADALAFFDALARKLAGRAIASQPLAAIAEAAEESFRHLRGVPHLVARVHESLVEAVDDMLRALARTHGFEGRVIVLGQDDIPVGDARLEWADGGIAGDRRSVEAAVDRALARAGATTFTSRTDP